MFIVVLMLAMSVIVYDSTRDVGVKYLESTKIMGFFTSSKTKTTPVSKKASPAKLVTRGSNNSKKRKD